MQSPFSADVPRAVVTAAERILSRYFGRRLSIVGLEPQAGASDWVRVFRCRLEGSGGPETAVLKVAVTPPPDPLRPAGLSGPPGPGARYANDHAGAAFLAALEVEPTLAPRLYGADAKERLVILEDLGDGPSLAEILTGSDPAWAEAGLEGFMRALGRMHAASHARADDYDRQLALIQRQASVKPALGSAEAEAANQPGLSSLAGWRARVRWEVQRFADTFSELDFEWTPPLVDDVQALTAAMLDPGPFLGFGHGDPCPVNVRLFPDPDPSRPGAVPLRGTARVVLSDFELGGLRHVLVDAAFPRMAFLSCGYCGTVPPSIVDRIESAYRVEVMKGIPEVVDEALFRRALTEACGFLLILSANRLLPHALRFEERWGLSTYRQIVLRHLAAFSETSLRFGFLPAFGSFASIMIERLRAKWPEVGNMAVFPAFARDRPDGTLTA